MKMRKRIAALIVAAMVASLMPMTTFASSNRVSPVVKVVEDGKTDAPELKIELKDRIATGQVFYLELDNAKWKADKGETVSGVKVWANAKETGPISDAVTVTVTGDKTASVEVDKDLAIGNTVVIPLKTKNIKGEATVEIIPWDTGVTAGKYVFATSSTAKATVSVGKPKSFYTGTGMELATITIEESGVGAFADSVDKEIEITLDNTDFKLEDLKHTDLKLGKGFSGSLTSDDIKINNVDKQYVVLTIKDASKFNTTQRGTIEITLKVASDTKYPAEGEISARISGDLVEDKDYKVATIAEYGVELKSDKDYEFVAGREEKVKFHLNEVVSSSLVSGRDVEFTLTEGVYFNESLTLPSNMKDLDLRRDDDGHVTGFVATVDLPNEDKAYEFKFEAKLQIPAAFTGDVVLKVDGRAVGEDLEVKLAEVKAPVTVKAEPMKIDVGQKSNKGGKITITEADKGMLRRGKTLVIQLPKDLKNDGVEFMKVKDLDIKTTGGIKTKDAKFGDNDESIEIEITRQSSEAGSIEISGFEVKSRRIIADGTYEIEIGGDAISALAGTTYKADSDPDKVEKYGIDKITAVDFLLVGDKATKAEVKFVIGSSKFLVDGKEMTMDAAAYIKDGRTMVPLRYLSVAIGIDEEAIKFGGGVITIIDGMRIIQLQNGSKDLVVNGMTIPMSAAAEIVDGRTYVPVSEIGAVFNVAGTWDPATQTATFK